MHSVFDGILPDGTYTVSYTALHSGRNVINVTLGDEGHVAESPYTINVQPKVKRRAQCAKCRPAHSASSQVDVTRTKVWGPGLEDGILDTQKQEFYIEPLDQDGNPLGPAGKGKPFKTIVEGPKGPVPTKVPASWPSSGRLLTILLAQITEDPTTGKRTVVYEPNAPGNYHIEVLYEDQHVANSPYDVRVDAGAFARNCIIESYSFVVRTKDREGNNLPAGGEKDNFSVTVDGPAKVDVQLDDLQGMQELCVCVCVWCLNS